MYIRITDIDHIKICNHIYSIRFSSSHSMTSYMYVCVVCLCKWTTLQIQANDFCIISPIHSAICHYSYMDTRTKSFQYFVMQFNKTYSYDDHIIQIHDFHIVFTFSKSPFHYLYPTRLGLTYLPQKTLINLNKCSIALTEKLSKLISLSLISDSLRRIDDLFKMVDISQIPRKF